MKNILRLNMEVCDKWDMILIKQNENFLARNSSVSFMFDNGDTIYICGGKDNMDQEHLKKTNGQRRHHLLSLLAIGLQHHRDTFSITPMPGTSLSK